jgi:beta-lactam-binding protein with PASTA domain
MKIAMKLVVEMTPEQVQGLANEYGLTTDVNTVREFTKSYIGNVAQQSAASEFWTATVA